MSTDCGKWKHEVAWKKVQQKLYDDIISLLKTGFTKSELKSIWRKIKRDFKMKEDGKPNNEIEAALKKLSLEIQEAKKRVTGQVVKRIKMIIVVQQHHQIILLQQKKLLILIRW